MSDVPAEVAATREEFVRVFVMFHGRDREVPDRLVLGDQEWDDLDAELSADEQDPETLRGTDHYVRETTAGPRGWPIHTWVRRKPGR